MDMIDIELEIKNLETDLESTKDESTRLDLIDQLKRLNDKLFLMEQRLGM